MTPAAGRTGPATLPADPVAAGHGALSGEFLAGDLPVAGEYEADLLRSLLVLAAAWR